MAKKTGTVEAISKEKRGVKIDGDWYDLIENVKIDYVRKGECEYTTNDDGKIIFIKSTGQEKKTSSESVAKKGETQIHMIRMSAVKAASRVYETTGKEKEMLELVKKLNDYIIAGTDTL